MYMKEFQLSTNGQLLEDKRLSSELNNLFTLRGTTELLTIKAESN